MGTVQPEPTLGIIRNCNAPCRGRVNLFFNKDPAGVKAVGERFTWLVEARLCNGVITWTANKLGSMGCPG
jgi:hypothetical protein